MPNPRNRPQTMIGKDSGQYGRINNRNAIKSPDLIEPSLYYASMIADGHIPASEAMMSFCARKVDHFDRMYDTDFPIIFDKEKADRIMRFVLHIVMIEGNYAGKTWIPNLWQIWYLRTLFGWIYKDTGLRVYKKSFCMTAKGTGKKVISASLLHYLLLYDNQPAAQIYAVAETMEQAQVVFRYATQIAHSTPILRNSGLTIWGGEVAPKRIFKGDNHAIALSATSKAPSGPLPSAILCDELHECTNDDMLKLLEAGYKNRDNRLTLITTNMHAKDESPCGREFEYAKHVALGELDDENYLPALYYNVEEDNVLEDESRWLASNPSLPDIPGYPYLRDMVKQATGMGGMTRGQVLRLNFSIVGQDGGDWMKSWMWKKVEVDELPAKTKPRYTYLGLDLSLSTDLTACAVVHDYDTHLEAWVRCWMPKGKVMEMKKTDKQAYDVFVEEGHLHLSGGDVMNYDDVADFIEDVHAETPVRTLAYDRWGMRKMMEIFEERNIPFTEKATSNQREMTFIEHPQSWAAKADPDKKKIHLAMPRSITRMEEAVLNKKIWIKKNFLLRTAAISSVLDHDRHANRKFVKKTKTSRIDPIVALTQAVGVALEYRATERRKITDVSQLFMGNI